MANRFHKLKNNESDFPLIGNVDVYKYDNDFDYSRYNAPQMDLQICTVPWDVGEAHVGQRTISGIGNVVWFGSKEKRDAWFDAIPDDQCYRFTTKFKELHREQVIDVEIPYDIAAKFNYLVVHYNLFANDESPVKWEKEDGLRDWFWFIREVEFIAPNTTRLHLLDDAFQTWMYDVNISGMMLERGHAPMFKIRAGDFLQNPVENNEHLLTEDVNFGDATQVKHIDALALNSGDMWACIATTANPQTDWGSKAANNWHTPASPSYTQNGVPSVFVFACEVNQLNTLLANINSTTPQFKQTVQGVFFAAKNLVSTNQQFSFCNVTCYTLSSNRTTLDLCELDKSLFGYDSRYSDIAKLYTSPYAHIEVTDENGNVDVIKIEDTTGSLDVSVALSLAFPYVSIDTHLLGAGGNATASVTYRNINAHTFNISGQWYETLKSWKIPTFAVVLDAATEYDYSTHFDRAQRVIDYTTIFNNTSADASTTKENSDAIAATSKTNSDAIASTNKTNADNVATNNKTNSDAVANANKENADTMAQAAKDNADASADTLVSNTAIQVAANSTINSRSNQSASSDSWLVNQYSIAMQRWEAGYTYDTTNNDVNAEYASAAIGAAGGALGGAVSGATSGAALGPVGAIAGAVGGLIGGAIGSAANVAQTAVAANLKWEQANATVGLSENRVSETSTNNTDRTNNQNSANSDNTETANNASTGASANSAATTKNNATRTKDATNTAASNTQSTELSNNERTYNTETGNNERTYNTEISNNERTYNTAIANNQRSYDTAIENAERTRMQAQKAIENDIAQAALRSPFIFGSFSDGDAATTKPIALFANIVTQSKSAIASAGDEMLRYGYRYDKQWEFDGNWNIGKYFTYWKLSDFWVYALNVPDMYMDKLRFFLFGGVTIWRRPEDIGTVSIYENF